MEGIGDVLGFVGSAVSGGLLGGIFRLIPLGLDLLKRWQDNKHELAMLRLQNERDDKQAKNKERQLAMQSQMVLDKGGLDALVEAVRSQGRPTGDAKIDRRSQSVRPNITYAFLWTYIAVKAALVTIAVLSAARINADILDTIAGATAAAWTPQDIAMFSGIINFWFLDRVIRKNEGK